MQEHELGMWIYLGIGVVVTLADRLHSAKPWPILVYFFSVVIWPLVLTAVTCQWLSKWEV